MLVYQIIILCSSLTFPLDICWTQTLVAFKTCSAPIFSVSISNNAFFLVAASYEIFLPSIANLVILLRHKSDHVVPALCFSLCHSPAFSLIVKSQMHAMASSHLSDCTLTALLHSNPTGFLI